MKVFHLLIFILFIAILISFSDASEKSQNAVGQRNMRKKFGNSYAVMNSHPSNPKGGSHIWHRRRPNPGHTGNLRKKWGRPYGDILKHPSNQKKGDRRAQMWHRRQQILRQAGNLGKNFGNLHQSNPKELAAKAAAEADKIEAKILKNKKNMRRQNKKPELREDDPVQSMTGNYYFIKSCCMQEAPRTVACQNSLSRFYQVCKVEIGAKPDACKTKANQLYKGSCKADPVFNGWPLLPKDGKRRRRLSRSMQEDFLHPVSTNQPMGVLPGPHRLLW